MVANSTGHMIIEMCKTSWLWLSPKIMCLEKSLLHILEYSTTKTCLDLITETHRVFTWHGKQKVQFPFLISSDYLILNDSRIQKNNWPA